MIRVLMNLRQWVTPVRRDWNAMGPHVPLFFRVALKRIDPQLVLQFIPPWSKDSEGIDPYRHPDGVWIVCRRLRRTGWLFKRWVIGLNDHFGQYCPPGRDVLDLIRTAKRLWKQGKAERMEDEFDRSVEASKYEDAEVSHAAMLERCAAACSNIERQFGHNHVFLPTNPLARA